MREGYLEQEGFPAPSGPVVVPARNQVRTSVRMPNVSAGDQLRIVMSCAVYLDGSGTGDTRCEGWDLSSRVRRGGSTPAFWIRIHCDTVRQLRLSDT
jgi:hypothetical protein